MLLIKETGSFSFDQPLFSVNELFKCHPRNTFLLEILEGLFQTQKGPTKLIAFSSCDDCQH